MNKLGTISHFFLAVAVIGMLGCADKKTNEKIPGFTRIDSLTEIYLNLHDSLLVTWNQMINDDNKKIKAMHNLLHEIQIAGQFDPEKINALEYRINQLKRIRYTPKSMANSDVVDEYDFASNSLVSELIAMAESHSAYSYNSTMQSLVEQIRTAEQRIENYRIAYDAVVMEYNSFLAKNREYMKDVESVGALEDKPLFQVTSH